MSIASGARIGVYEVAALIAAGGSTALNLHRWKTSERFFDYVAARPKRQGRCRQRRHFAQNDRLGL